MTDAWVGGWGPELDYSYFTGKAHPSGYTPYSSRSETGTYFIGVATNDKVSSGQQPSRTDGGTGMLRKIPSSFSSGRTLIDWLNSGSTPVLRVQAISSGVLQLQYWNGSSWTGIGSGITVPGGTGVVYRWLVDFSGCGGSSGALTFKIVIDGAETVVGTETASGLNLTSVTNIAEVRAWEPGNTSQNYTVTEMFMKDGSAMAAYAYCLEPDGTGDNDGSGTYTAVDDLTTDAPDTDFMGGLASTGQRQSVTFSLPSLDGRYPKMVGAGFRLRCGATGPTQVVFYLKIGGTRYYWGGGSGTPQSLTTTFARYWRGWAINPATGAAWTPAELSSGNLEPGWEAV